MMNACFALSVTFFARAPYDSFIYQGVINDFF